MRLTGVPAIIRASFDQSTAAFGRTEPGSGRPHVPTYDYQCRSCGNTIEVIHSMLADGPAACEICGGALRRVIHPTGIIFKGTGFYKTDSRSPTNSDSSARSAPSTTPSTDGPSKESGAGTRGGSGSTAGTGGDASSGDASSSKSSSGSPAPNTAKRSGGPEVGGD